MEDIGQPDFSYNNGACCNIGGKLHLIKRWGYLRYASPWDCTPEFIGNTWDLFKAAPREFREDFDAITTALDNPKALLITKGRLYIKMEEKNGALVMLRQKPTSIRDSPDFGQTGDYFAQGLESLTTVGGLMYGTKGGKCLTVKMPPGSSAIADDGKPLSEWPGLPAEFQKGFDAACYATNNKLYILKGEKYVRCDGFQSAVNEGYPAGIKGAWN